MVRMIGKSVRASLFIILTGCGAWNALAQTTNYSIPAGSGTLTYTETVSTNNTCPVSQPPAASQQITQYTFSNFAYNGQSLSGSIDYLSVPSPNSWCPQNLGWQGPIPYILTETGFYIFVTPALSGGGSATTNAITVSANPNPSVYGSSVQFTATEQFPNAAGTVTFSDGSTTLGSATMSNKVASYSIASLAVGSHSITAAYSSSNGLPSATSPALSFTVNKATPGLSVSCSPSTATYGSVNVNCTPYLSGGSSPTGSLSWGYTGGGGCTPGTWVSGWGLSTSVGNWAGFSPTIITVCAQYSGDSNNNSVSASTTFTINKATPSGGITCSPNPVTYQNGATQTATCTASLSAVGQGTTPTGSASIYWSGNFWASPALSGGSASLTGFNGLGVGSYSITGTYSGDGNYNGISLSSTTETIGAASQTISFTAPSSPVTYGVSPIVLSASASSGLGVSFSWSSGPCSVSGNTLTFTGAGTCVVAANQAGNSNYNAAPQVTQTVVVNAAATVSQVSSNTNPTTFGQSVTFSSLVNTGGGTPTGTVTFEDGGVSIGTGSVSTVSTTNLIPYSEQIGGTSWYGYCGGGNITTNTSAVTAPDGTSTATAILLPSSFSCGGSGAWGALVNSTSGLTAGQTYTASLWLRGATGGESVGIALNDCSGWPGVTLTTSWQRYSVTFSSISSSVVNCSDGSRGFQFVDTSNPNDTVYAWGAQLEALSSEGPYVETQASAQSGYGGIASFSTSSLAPVSNSITAVYGGDSNDSASTSPALNQTVNYATPTVTVNSASVAYGASTCFTITVSSSVGTPTGTVTVSSPNAGTWGTITLSNGSQSACYGGGFAAGSYTVTGTYNGNADFALASGTGTLTVTQASQAIAFTAPSSPVRDGVSPIALSASTSSGLAVSFSWSSGPCSVSGSTLTITGTGTCVIAANQAGNSNYAAAPQVTQSVVVNDAVTVSQVSSNTNPTTSGQSVTFSSLVNTGGVTPTGTVRFEDGGGSVGTGTVSTVSTTNLMPNSSNLGVAWGPNAGSFTPSGYADPFGGTTAGILTNTAANDSYISVVQGGLTASTTYTFSVWLKVPSGTLNTYLFIWDPSWAWGTNTNCAVTASWSRCILTTSSQADTSLRFVIGGGNTIENGVSLEMADVQVEASASAGPYIATGASPQAGEGGVATFSTSSLAAGAHSITAVYGGDSNDSGSTSSVLNQMVSSTAGGSLPTTGLGTVSYQKTTTPYICGQYSVAGTQYEFSNFTFTPTAGGAPVPLSGNPIYYMTASGAGCPPLGWQAPSPVIFQGPNLQVYVTESGSGNSPSISTSINTLTLAPPYSGTMVYGTSLTFTAKQWNPSATGSITFFSGTTSLATVALVNGTASYTLTTQLNASTTPYSISATYNSSNGYATVSSPATAETVTQAPQSITFTSPSSATYGSGPITLSATGGASGNPVTFSLSSGPGSLSGNQLTISGAGTITVIANQAGNTNYSAATATTQSITVSKAALTITVSNATKTYGSGNPNFGYQPSGFVNGDTSSVLSGTPSYSTPATPASAVGSYTISASTGTLSAANYSFSFVSGTLTVTQAVLTVTANNTSRPYAAANPTFTASYTGWFNGDTPSVLSGSPSLTTTAVSSSVVGTYPITAAIGSLSSVNYSFIFANGTLTITPATPVITWATPAAVPNGTYLTSTQLNATANTPGTFVYNPAALTAMTEGNQTLSTTFTPTDTTDYTTATGSVSLMVTLAPATGIITTIAGNNEFGYAGNGGIATSAALRWPQGVATDSAGNLYIADSSNNVVRKVAASTGIITLYAGTGTMGFSGDGGAATSAELNGPLGVAVDSQGNLYIADAFNCVIRKVTPGGTITTVAGQGTVVGSAGNGVAATSATLFYPFGVAVDSAGNFYIADTRNNLIRKVTVSTGIITTVAGTLTPTSLGDGGPAIGASLGSPASVAVDSSNNIYIADAGYYRIREVSASTGNITTVAGNGTLGYSGDGGPATAANLNYPESLTLDAAGNLYIADTNNNVIRKVDSYGIISTVGNGTAGYTGDGGPAILAELDRPAGIALDSAANIYISDTMNSVIRAVGGGPIAPSISWASPSDIVYGTALGSNQLNASSPVAGTYTYSPAAGTVLTAGQHTLSVTFTPTDTSDYQTATYSVALTVNPATPVITWANPAAISDTTALTTSQQLNATASTAGTFTYSPSAGTVLAPGTHLLIAKFTPGDTTDFNPVTAYASIDVNTGSRQDAGTVTLSVNTGSGYTTVASTNYSAGATTSSIAEGLAGGVMAGSPVTVNAVNDEVNIAANPSCIQAGNCQSTNYPYIIQTTAWDSTLFTNPSFAYPEIMGNLEGGSAGSSTQQTIYQYTVPSNGYDPDGNLVNYNDTVMGTWSFNYDSLNRLSAGTQTPVSGQGQSPQSLCWTYDSFGNRTAQTTSNQPFANAAGASSCQLASGASLIGNVVNAYSSYTNQVTSTNARGVTATPNYDADGNVTSDGVNEYLYDAEDRICAVASTPVNGMTVLTGYIYDAAGTRVSKGMIQTWSCDPTISGFTPTNDYVLAPGGEQLTEYAMSTTNGVSAMAWLHTNVFAAGHLIATYDDTEVYFYLDDQVGTRRVQTDYAGNIKQTCSSLPYGDGETCGSTPTEHLFTGKERDTESGNDYFGARYYSSVMGRFMSPDWSAKYEPVPYAKLDNPQTLNLYAYVMNNPLTRFDPDGHACDSLWHCAQGFLNAVEVKVSASLGTQGSVQWGVAKAEYHATVVGVEGTSGLGGGNKDATVSTGVGASASASGGPLKASVSANAGAQISTTDGASASVGASGKVALGPTSASASASMDQNGAHTSVGPGAGTGKDTDWKIGGGFTAGVGAGGAVNFTQLGRAFGDMGDSISNLGGYLKDKLMPSGAPSSSGGAPGISDPQHPF